MPEPIDVRDTLTQLIRQAEAASQRMSVRNPNRQLLSRLCFMSIALATRVAELEQAAEEKPRIVLS